MKLPNTFLVILIATMSVACSSGGENGCRPPDALLCGIFADPAPAATVTVDAGSDRTVIAGDRVGLGINASHSQGNHLDYRWEQISGPAVEIDSPTSGHIQIEAPSVNQRTSFTFQARATAYNGLTNSDTVTIHVEPISAYALCSRAPLFVTSYAWANNGCTTNSSDIAGDSRVATIYRQAEIEPNGSMQTATPLQFGDKIANEQAATDSAGSISGVESDFDDFFIFTPPETGIYVIFLCNDPLVCVRATSTDEWFLSLSSQDFETIAGIGGGTIERLALSVSLEAGLPYYVGVHAAYPESRTWVYNLTILSEGN